VIGRSLLYLWSAPTGAVGLLVLALAWCLRWVRQAGRWRGAIVVEMRGPLARWMGRPQAVGGGAPGAAGVTRRWAAVTLGWCIFLWDPPEGQVLPHEHGHVEQVLVLGPLFFPVYLLVLLALATRFAPTAVRAVGWRWRAIGAAFMRAYYAHPLEARARAHAEALLGHDVEPTIP
jgi:hypothetical protein